MNRLALHATIEAAGAGEAGRGFAIVEAEDLVREIMRAADQRRHLAQALSTTV